MKSQALKHSQFQHKNTAKEKLNKNKKQLKL